VSVGPVGWMIKWLTMFSLVRPLAGWVAGVRTSPGVARLAMQRSGGGARQRALHSMRSTVRRFVATLPEAHTVGGEGVEVSMEDTSRVIAAKSTIAAKQAAALAGRGIESFTEIQALSYDAVYEGKDLLGKSRTGTGKTIAFGLPLIERLAERMANGEYKQRRGRGPAIVVLTPTRELARQVEAELSLLGQTHGLATACFHGGVSYAPQEKALGRGLDVLVATVGRVIDHLERGTLDLSESYHIVLDESDEMLSMGFADEVERIISYAPAGERVASSSSSSSSRSRIPAEDRDFFDSLFDDEGGVDEPAPKAPPKKKALARRPQTLLFSATVPSWVKQLTSKYLEDPVFVDVVGDATQQAATTVTHKAILTPYAEAARQKLLEDIITVEVSSQLGQECDDVVGGGGRVIVFASTKRECDDLAAGPAFKRLSCQVLHGDIGQSQRDATLAQFRRGAFAVLIATDVAARGIDVRGVDLVVQYRVPRDPEAYVHRSGRTGRAGRAGTAVVLYDEREERDVRTLERECGLKFLRQHPPSPPAVLEASARDATLALGKVSDDVLPYFRTVADALVDATLAADDDDDDVDDLASLDGAPSEEEGEEEKAPLSPEEAAFKEQEKMRRLVAKCLAAIARKTDLQPRSLLTGEDGVMTLAMTAPRDLRTGDVVYAVSRLLERLPSYNENDNSGSAVGVVRVCEQPDNAVFDLPALKARELLKFVATQSLSKFSFSECTELPALQRTFNSGGDRRQPRGSRGAGGRGSYNNNNNNNRNDRGGGYRGGGGGGYARRDRDSGGRRGYSSYRPPNRDSYRDRDDYRPPPKRDSFRDGDDYRPPGRDRRGDRGDRY